MSKNTPWMSAEKEEQQIANAQLIAAAPELLEALKNLLEAGDELSNKFGCPLAVDRAHAAINKAEGEA